MEQPAPPSRPPTAGDAVASRRAAPMTAAVKRSFLMVRPLFFAGTSARAGGPSADRPERFRGKTNVDLALRQWHTLAQTLSGLGVDVLAAMPDRSAPDGVFIGAAGLLVDRSARRCVADKVFIASTVSGKASEGAQDAMSRAVRAAGFSVDSFEHRFGGAGDFFRVGGSKESGSKYVFACAPGPIDNGPGGARRLLAMLGPRAPDWSSDPRLREPLAEMVPGCEVHSLVLSDPRYPRGDMVATSVGPERSVLVVNVRALHEDGQRLVLGRKARISDTVIPLSEEDAALYAAGLIQLPATTAGGKPKAIIPEGVSKDLLGRLERVGCDCVPVDLSEWIKKDRGGPAALALDLGYLRDDRRTETPEVRDHRAAMRAGLDRAPEAG